jgi:hypothetical protein
MVSNLRGGAVEPALSASSPPLLNGSLLIHHLSYIILKHLIISGQSLSARDQVGSSRFINNNVISEGTAFFHTL